MTVDPQGNSTHSRGLGSQEAGSQETAGQKTGEQKTGKQGISGAQREFETAKSASRELSIIDLQQHIREMYYEKDLARGVDGTFMWLMEEMGELASALRGEDRENLAEEFADVIAWLATIANVAEIDLNQALVAKYGSGCPGCSRLVCQCPDSEKP